MLVSADETAAGPHLVQDRAESRGVAAGERGGHALALARQFLDEQGAHPLQCGFGAAEGRQGLRVVPSAR